VRRCPACTAPCERRLCAACGAALSAGPYQVVAVTSHDPYGMDYLATRADGTYVTLRERRYAASRDQSAIAALMREGNLLQQLDHPSIQKVFELFELNDEGDPRAYLVLSAVEGHSLASFLQQRAFTELEACNIARQALATLAYLQQRMVAHRSISPSALWFAPSGSLTMTDFERPQDPGLPPALSSAMGYAPPELARGQLNPTTDVYALGLTLFVALTRAGPPPNTQAFRAALSAVNVRPAFAAWLLKCTAESPGRRYADANSAWLALENLQVDGPPPDPRQRPARLIAVIGVAVLGLVAAGVWLARS
jgi:serine/threonine protein kinase